MRRAMWQTVFDLVDSVQPTQGAESMVNVTQLWLDLPFEVVVQPRPSGPEVLGDLPRWRWRTAFDLAPGRVKLRVAEAGVS